MAERLTRVPHVPSNPGLDFKTSNPGPAKSYTALQTVRHCFNIYESSYVALALWRGVGHRTLVTLFGVNTARIMKGLVFVLFFFYLIWELLLCACMSIL